MKRGAAGPGEPPGLEDVKACIEKRLFIGRVPPAATEREMLEVFGAFGVLSECRVLADRGVAFVGYDSWAAAHRALLETDGQMCLSCCTDTPVSVSFAERTGTVGRGGGAHLAKGLEHTRVFVGGLPEAITDQDLWTLFETFGRVEAANLLAAKSNRRCGFVNFSIWGEALDAVEHLDGRQYPGAGGEAVTVVFASPREANGAKHRRLDGAAAFQQQPGRDEGDLEFESVKVAYLAAVDGDSPAEVCNELHRKVMALRPARRRTQAQVQALPPTLTMAPASLGGEDPALSSALAGSVGCEDRDAARLFVGGLPHECNDEELRALVDQVPFSGPPPQRMLTECRVLPGRGCGYIRFASWEAAQEALQALNERSVSGWPMPLRVTWATPKASLQPQQPQQLQHQPQEAQWAQAGSGLELLGGALQSLLGGDAGAILSQLAGGAGAAQAASPDEAAVAAQGLDPRRLFVGQLTRELSEKVVLLRLFEPFGKIESLRWLEDKGVAYVQYDDFVAAHTALETLNGRHVPGISREQGLNVAFSKKR